MAAEAEARIARAVSRARVTLLWEAIWPLAAPFLVLAAIFVSVSWLGLWRVLSLPFRYAVLAIFAAGLVWCLANLRHFRIPSRAAAFARVERTTGAAHRPATALTDRLASGDGDAAAEVLWQAHRRRALAALTHLRAGLPSPRLAARDPFALRFLAILILAIAYFAAGPERLDRLAEAFRGGETPAALLARIDAWVAPPAYTGRPPLFLTGAAAPASDAGPLTVPAGSVVTVRIGGANDLNVTASADRRRGAGGRDARQAGADDPQQRPADRASGDARCRRHRFDHQGRPRRHRLAFHSRARQAADHRCRRHPVRDRLRRAAPRLFA